MNIKLENICKSYSGNLVLNNINLDIKAGEIHALVGENGAGKSTLMKVLVGVEIADSGEIFINNEKRKWRHPIDARNAGIAMVFQELSLIPSLTATDRDGAIDELVCSLDKAGKLGKGNCKEIIKAMIKREKEASTGMGKGVAVPHVKHAAVKDVVAVVGLSDRGIDFSSLDKQPVYSVILLISPEGDPDKHLQAMESVFRHLQQEKFRKFLRQCRTAEQIEDLLIEADENPSL